MKTYLVGGAVRDQLLKLGQKDKDFVVVGSSPEQMQAQGFKPVGRDFPVFLHPKTKEEYALARLERKVGKGYRGFVCESGQHVSLEEDLARRDLTINAMAQDVNGQLIDPFNGLQDLNNKLLRHVSTAFRDDPVRLLRVARFAATFAHLGFQIHHDTLRMLYEMVQSGEINALVPERVWRETEKALNTKFPSVYFKVLRACGALKVIFPELDALYGIPANKMYHGEIDSGIHTMMVLDEASFLTDLPQIRFAALLHDLGKAKTGFCDLPSHPAHAEVGVDLVHSLCQRIAVPNIFKDLAFLACRYHTAIHRSMQLDSLAIVSLLHELGAFRKHKQFLNLLQVCMADASGRIYQKGEIEGYPQVAHMKKAFDIASQVTPKSIVEAGFKGKEIQVQYRLMQAEKIKQEFRLNR